MEKNEIESQSVGTGTQLQGNDSLDFDKMTGRYLYFRPENNRDYRLVCTGWKMQEKLTQGVIKYGIHLDVLSVDGVPCSPAKIWDTTSVRIIKALEPIIIKARIDRRGEIKVVFRKSLGSGQKDTEAVFTVEEV